MAWGKKVRKPSDVVAVGDQVEVVILAIDTEARRMGLGLKQALGDPWVEVVKTIHPGAAIEGPVTRLTPFGAFVELAPGVEGLVHISEITAERRLNHPSDLLRVGEVVKAQVLEVDREKRQLKLSIKQLVPTGLDEFLVEHLTGDVVSGRIVEIDEVSQVARIELGEGITALCAVPPIEPSSAAGVSSSGPVDLSQLGSFFAGKWKTEVSKTPKPAAGSVAVAARPAAGQVRSFRLTAVNVAEKKLELVLL